MKGTLPWHINFIKYEKNAWVVYLIVILSLTLLVLSMIFLGDKLKKRKKKAGKSNALQKTFDKK